MHEYIRSESGWRWERVLTIWSAAERDIVPYAAAEVFLGSLHHSAIELEGIIGLRIKCVNTKCTEKSFEWDEKRRLAEGGRVAAPHAEGAVRVTVACPHCMTENVVWLKKVQKNVGVARK